MPIRSLRGKNAGIAPPNADRMHDGERGIRQGGCPFLYRALPCFPSGASSNSRRCECYGRFVFVPRLALVESAATFDASPWIVSVVVVFTTVSVTGTETPLVVSIPFTVEVSAVSLSFLPHAATAVKAMNAATIVLVFMFLPLW